MGIRMSKKKALLLILALICIVIIIFYMMQSPSYDQNTEEDQTQSNPPENPKEPQLVIPESPLGTLGLISALAAGFGIFEIIKKKS